MNNDFIETMQNFMRKARASRVSFEIEDEQITCDRLQIKIDRGQKHLNLSVSIRKLKTHPNYNLLDYMAESAKNMLDRAKISKKKI